MKTLFTFFLCAIACCSMAQNEWVKVASFGAGERERAVAFTIGSRGYVGTGQDSANYVKKDLWEYDPSTDSWTQKADLPGQGRRDAVGFAIGNRGYIATGINSSTSYLGTKLKDVYEYNPVTNTWTQKANYPGNSNGGIYYASAFVASGRGYICCGKKGPSYYSSELWEFNPAANTWTQKQSFPGGVRYGTASFAIGNFGYVGCGADENVYCNDWYVFNPATNSWSPKANFPGSERFNMVGLTIGIHGFAGMGTDGGSKKDWWEYYPQSDYWQQRADLSGGDRRSAVGFAIGNYGYVGLGKGSSGIKRSMYRYTPMPNKFSSVENSVLSCTVVPNPIHDKAQLFSSINFSNGRLIIRDVSGNALKQMSDLSSPVTIKRENLPDGIYFYELVMEDVNGSIHVASGKFLFQ